jgi:hypothetical protein
VVVVEVEVDSVLPVVVASEVPALVSVGTGPASLAPLLQPAITNATARIAVTAFVMPLILRLRRNSAGPCS